MFIPSSATYFFLSSHQGEREHRHCTWCGFQASTEAEGCEGEELEAVSCQGSFLSDMNIFLKEIFPLQLFWFFYCYFFFFSCSRGDQESRMLQISGRSGLTSMRLTLSSWWRKARRQSRLALGPWAFKTIRTTIPRMICLLSWKDGEYPSSHTVAGHLDLCLKSWKLQYCHQYTVAVRFLVLHWRSTQRRLLNLERTLGAA